MSTYCSIYLACPRDTQWDPESVAKTLVRFVAGNDWCSADPDYPRRWQLGTGNNVWLWVIGPDTFRVDFRSPWSEAEVTAVKVLLWKLYRIRVTRADGLSAT